MNWRTEKHLRVSKHTPKNPSAFTPLPTGSQPTLVSSPLEYRGGYEDRAYFVSIIASIHASLSTPAGYFGIVEENDGDIWIYLRNTDPDSSFCGSGWIQASPTGSTRTRMRAIASSLGAECLILLNQLFIDLDFDED